MSQNRTNKIQPQQQQVMQRHELEIKSGPLPDPEVLAQYDRALPGTAQIIVEAFVKQVDHRIQIEKGQMDLKDRQMAVVERYADIDSRNSLLGIITAGIIGLAAIGLGAYAISNGHAIAGSVIGGLGVSSIVGTFIYGTSINRKQDNTSKHSD